MKKFILSSLSLLDNNADQNQVAADSALNGKQHTEWLHALANATQQTQQSNNYESFLGLTDAMKFSTDLEKHAQWGQQGLQASRLLQEDGGDMSYAFSEMSASPDVDDLKCSVKIYQESEAEPVMFRFFIGGLVPDESHVIGVQNEGGDGGCAPESESLQTWAGADLKSKPWDGVDHIVNFDLSSDQFTIIKDKELEGKVNILGKSLTISQKEDADDGTTALKRLCCGDIEFLEKIPEDGGELEVAPIKLQQDAGDEAPAEGEEAGDEEAAEGEEAGDEAPAEGEAGDETTAEGEAGDETPAEGEEAGDETTAEGEETGDETPAEDGEATEGAEGDEEASTDETATDTGDATGEEGTGEEGTGEEGTGEEGTGEEGTEEVPEEEAEEEAEEPPMPVKLLKSHSKLPDFSIQELVRKFADISAACEEKNCILEQDMNVRVDAFGHKTDEESGDTAFYAVSQKFTKEDDQTKVSIVFIDYTLTKDGTLTPGPEVELIPVGSKPQVWKTGHLELDPILVAYETPSREGTGNQIYINQYDTLEQMKAGEFSDFIMLPRTMNSRNEGSPTWEFISFTGMVRTSTFTMFYEYQHVTGPTYIAKGRYSFDTSSGFKWEPFETKVHEIFLDYGLVDIFGSRVKFMYGGHYFYLMEATKYNEESQTLENHIALCDSGMVPLALVPFKLPEGSSNATNFFSPHIERIGMNEFAVTIQLRERGEEFESDWNEIDNYPEKTTTIKYFIEKDHVTEAPPVPDEEKKRKRKVREKEPMMISFGKSVMNQMLSYAKTVFWSLRLIK